MQKLMFLVIDRRKTMQKSIAFLLRWIFKDVSDSEYEIRQILSIKEAYNLFDDEDFVDFLQSFIVIVICEIEMDLGRMNGLELAIKCRKDPKYEKCREFNFIMMHGGLTVSLVSEMGEQGFENILSKPFSMEELSKPISKILDGIKDGSSIACKEAVALIKEGRYKEALKVIPETTNISPARLAILRSSAFLGLKLFDLAEEEITAVVPDTHISSILVLNQLSEVYTAKKDWEKLIAILRELAEKSPRNYKKRMELVAALAQLNCIDEANEALNDLLKANPKPETLVDISRLLKKVGRGEEAIKLEERILSQYLSDLTACVKLADIFRDEGEFEKAGSVYEKLARIYPNSEAVWLSRGLNDFGWWRKKRNPRMLKRAEECFRKVLEINSESSDAQEGLNSIREVFQLGH